MKRIIALVCVLVSYTEIIAQQATLPEVLKKVDFAGITVRLDADAQKLVQKEVSSLLVPENKYLTDKLQRIQLYFPIIEHILEQEQVPEDFKYLAVVESSLLPDAISTSNAVGFWQMKQATAQEVGLRVDNAVDERKNVYASTRAAALYLKRNNQIYKNWVSTLYSYTLGAAGISKIVPAQWSNATEIVFDGQTNRYLIKTLACRIAFEHRLNRLKEPNFAFVEYKKTKGKTLDEIASAMNVDDIELRKHNSWLQTRTIPADYSVSILVPIERLDEVQSKVSHQKESTKSYANYPVLKKVTLVTANEDDPVFYQMNGKKGVLAKPGDDVASLARGSKIKIPDFLRYNDMSDTDFVEEGKIYYLQKKDRKGPTVKHVVGTGESLWDVSQMYGVRLKNLFKLNRLRTAVQVQSGSVVYLQNKRPRNEPIESGVEKNKEEFEKVPIVENYEEKVLAKDSRKTNKKAKPEEVLTTSKEVAVVEGNKPDADGVTASEDDIVVINEEEEALKKPATKPAAPTVLIKPATTTVTSTTTTTAAKKPAASTNTHMVDVGETLYGIARKYNASVKDLAVWNNIATDERVKVGQELIVRGSPKNNITNSSKEKKTASSVHAVKKGDTLFSISQKYNVTMKQIRDWNNMNDKNVKIGQKLVVRR